MEDGLLQMLCVWEGICGHNESFFESGIVLRENGTSFLPVTSLTQHRDTSEGGNSTYLQCNALTLTCNLTSTNNMEGEIYSTQKEGLPPHLK